MMIKGRKLYTVLITSISLFVSAQENIIFEELPFNTKEFNEYAPVVYQNKLIYCSDQKKDVFITYNTEDGKSFSDIYEVPNIGGQRWTNPVPFAPELMSQHHEGPLSFDYENDRIYFTRNIRFDNSFGNYTKDDNTLNIYYSSYINGEYRNPQLVFTRSDQKYSYAFPAISPEGDILIYSSDIQGGFGGFDLYICRLKGRRWSDPENMGENINTGGHEIYPFIHSSGRVYFSSNRKNGMGRQDIYYTYEYEGTWSIPENIGEPFNSKFNDFGVYISDDLKSGYITSDRKRSNDIYRFEILYPTFDECKPMEENYFCYEFYDKTNAELDTMAFKYQWDLGDGTIVTKEQVEHCYAEPGTYFVQLNVIDVVTGEILENQSNYTMDIKYIEQVYINSVDTVYTNEEIVFDGLETNLENFDIDEYYWFFGDDDWALGSTVSHKYQKPGIYEVHHGITSVMDEKTQIKKACCSKRIIVLKR